MSQQSPEYLVVQAEARYAARLTERTARMYRHIADTCAAIAFIGFSGTALQILDMVPRGYALAFAFVTILASAVLFITRPGDKAFQNECDSRRYKALLARAHDMSADEFALALKDAREQDCPQEVESLRHVAYNDTVREIGREDCVKKLTFRERVLDALA
jgi:hypothetical protein